MIVVVGLPRLGPSQPPAAAGLAVAIARRAAEAGASVQLMGKLGDDPEGDLLLLDLAAAGIGHPAMLRDHARRTPVGPRRRRGELAVPTLEPADLELGLRYVPDFSVLILAAPELPALVRPAAEAASFAGAHLIVIARARARPDGLPDGATVISAPRSGADGESALAALVASYAVALDAGEDSAVAWRRAAAGSGVAATVR